MTGTVPLDRRQRRRQETIEQVLDVAVEVMADQGVAGLTLGEVARRMGIRPPSLYVYFDGKHALYDALFERGWRELLRHHARRRGGAGRHRPGRRPRCALESAFVRWAVEHPAYAPLMFWRPVPGFIAVRGGLRPGARARGRRAGPSSRGCGRRAPSRRGRRPRPRLPHPDRRHQRRHHPAARQRTGRAVRDRHLHLHPARRGGHVAGPPRRAVRPPVRLIPERHRHDRRHDRPPVRRPSRAGRPGPGHRLRLAATEYGRFAALLRTLAPEDWARPTDCPAWDVRAMAGHVLGMAEMVGVAARSVRAERRGAGRAGGGIDALTALQVRERRRPDDGRAGRPVRGRRPPRGARTSPAGRRPRPADRCPRTRSSAAGRSGGPSASSSTSSSPATPGCTASTSAGPSGRELGADAGARRRPGRRRRRRVGAAARPALPAAAHRTGRWRVVGRGRAGRGAGARRRGVLPGCSPAEGRRQALLAQEVPF